MDYVLNTLASDTCPSYNLLYTPTCHTGLHTPTFFIQPYVNTIIEANDIEMNPGPVSAELKAVMDTINDNVNSKFDILHTNLLHLTSAINAIKVDVSDLKSRLTVTENNQCSLKTDLATISTRLDALEDARERQEQYSRRENVLLYGVPESAADADYASLRKRVSKILNENVTSKSWAPEDILRTHRLGTQSSTSSKPRPLIVRLVQFHDKLAILKARPQLRLQGLGVGGDLTPKQRAQLDALPDDQRGYFKAGKLVVVPRAARGVPPSSGQATSSATSPHSQMSSSNSIA